MTAFVFDLDGTLVDSRIDIATACNHALVASGREPLPIDRVATFVGDGARKLLARAFGTDDVEAPLAEFLRYYAAHPVDHTRWMPGARDALAKLVPAAIVTNKARVVAERVVEALGIRVEVLVAGGDCPLKPDPAPILRAVAALGSRPSETWVIGDGVQDALAGKAAGCPTIAVLGGFHAEDRLRAAGPTRVVSSLEELLTAPDALRLP